jgi:hypothetical protein
MKHKPNGILGNTKEALSLSFNITYVRNDLTATTFLSISEL